MTEQLAGYMQGRGYQMMVTNVPGLVFLFRQEMQSVNVLIVIEELDGSILPEQYHDIKEQMHNVFERRGVGELHTMGLMITNKPETALSLYGDEHFLWLIDSRSSRLLVYEHQAEDFYGLKGILEEFLTEYEGSLSVKREESGAGDTWNHSAKGGDHVTGNGASASGEGQRSLRQTLQNLPLVTGLLVSVNVIVYLICTWSGEVLYNSGELLGAAVMERGEFYRMITCMFLHADTGHLFGNMLMLYALGTMLEQHFGHIRYGLLYLLSGIGAAAASMWYQLWAGRLTGSIGASGAVYGLIGALLFLVIAGRGRFRSVTFPRILLCIAYSLYSGLAAENIDNAAHIGGLLCGFVLAVILSIGKSAHTQIGSDERFDGDLDKKGTDKE